jgi:hypothetical protein
MNEILKQFAEISSRLAFGCPRCTFEESDGSLRLHCPACQFYITRKSHELYISNGTALTTALNKVLSVSESGKPPSWREHLDQMRGDMKQISRRLIDEDFTPAARLGLDVVAALDEFSDKLSYYCADDFDFVREHRHKS